MRQTTTYDAIVIGTSQGDRFLPITLAKAGRKVAQIERGPIGGVCVNIGCTPTKTMVASAIRAQTASIAIFGSDDARSVLSALRHPWCAEGSP